MDSVMSQILVHVFGRISVETIPQSFGYAKDGDRCPLILTNDVRCICPLVQLSDNLHHDNVVSCDAVHP